MCSTMKRKKTCINIWKLFIFTWLVIDIWVHKNVKCMLLFIYINKECTSTYKKKYYSKYLKTLLKYHISK